MHEQRVIGTAERWLDQDIQTVLASSQGTWACCCNVQEAHWRGEFDFIQGGHRSCNCQRTGIRYCFKRHSSTSPSIQACSCCKLQSTRQRDSPAHSAPTTLCYALLGQESIVTIEHKIEHLDQNLPESPSKTYSNKYLWQSGSISLTWDMGGLIFAHTCMLGPILTNAISVLQGRRLALMSCNMSAPWSLYMRSATTMWSPVSATVPFFTTPSRMLLSPSPMSMYQAMCQQSSWQALATLCLKRSEFFFHCYFTL